MPRWVEATEGETFETVRPGTYRMILREIEDAESGTWNDPNKIVAKWIFKFEIDPDRHPKTVRDDGTPCRIHKWMTAIFTPRSKAREIAQAMLDREFAKDEKFDIDELVGLPVMGVVGYKEDPKTKQVVRNSDGTPERNVITAFQHCYDDDDDDAPPTRLAGAASHASKF